VIKLMDDVGTFLPMLAKQIKTLNYVGK